MDISNEYIFTTYPWMKGLNLYNIKERNWNYLYELPEGWVNSFISDWLNEVDAIYQKFTPEQKENFYVEQLKEKYGIFTQYFSFETEELAEVIYKYENISWHTCVHCGAPASKHSLGYILPYCEKHAPLQSKDLTLTPW
jgi:hypothetical protein